MKNEILYTASQHSEATYEEKQLAFKADTMNFIQLLLKG